MSERIEVKFADIFIFVLGLGLGYLWRDQPVPKFNVVVSGTSVVRYNTYSGQVWYYDRSIGWVSIPQPLIEINKGGKEREFTE